MNQDRPFNTEDADSVRERVSKDYARAVTGDGGANCCTPLTKGVAVQSAGYSAEDLAGLPTEAAANAFGCGNPLAFAEVEPGQTVLDLGCGAGIDLILAARRVGPTGRVIGVDMTAAMLETARAAVMQAGLKNVELREGLIEDLPVGAAEVDWVISNCVINLSPDKPRVFHEIHRVLRPGGQMLVSDIVSRSMPPELRDDPAVYCSCVGSSISEEDYCRLLREAGMTAVEVEDRFVYSAAQLQGIIASDQAEGTAASSCNLTAAADRLAGDVWSARVRARRP